jgi:tetratricopeptide (TPR) repeat protein
MRNILLLVCAVTLLVPLPSFAEVKVVTHTVQQPFGGSQSPDDARTAGIARAKREALEQFGTYIESSTVVKNSQVDSDEILALTAGVTKAEVIKQKNYTDGDGFGLEITVKVELDTAVLDQSLKRLLQDRNHLKDLKAARVREKELLTRIAELEKENQQKGRTEKQKIALKKEFKQTRLGLTAVEWFDKAIALGFSDLQKRIEYLTQAVQLNPGYADAYYSRGNAYTFLQQYKQAIRDFSQVIRLDPTNASAYSNRGNAYVFLQQYKQAISDYSQAIRLDPSYADAYYNRGNTYVDLKQYQRSIDDYTQAIQLEPTNAFAYGNRGHAYTLLRQHKYAISDYSQVIRLDPSNAAAYTKRGLVYALLKQYQTAMSDFNQAIQIDPTFATAYSRRAIVYGLLGQGQAACRDLQQACLLGDCGEYEGARQQGACR